MAVQPPNPVPDRNLEQARFRLFESALFQDQRGRQFDPAGVDALLSTDDECVAVRKRFSAD